MTNRARVCRDDRGQARCCTVGATLLYKKGEDTRRHTPTKAPPEPGPTPQKNTRDTGTPTPERYLKVRPSLDTPLSEPALMPPRITPIPYPLLYT